MSSSNATTQSQAASKTATTSQIPTQFRAISRNNSNTSTASSSNRGDLSSIISTANSTTSSRSQLSKLIDHRQLFGTCGNSTPIRSFQRATISSVVKTRAFDNNPILQNLLTTPSPSGQNSVSNSQTPSPLSTPIFSRSRSLRMSGGPNRYGPAHAYRTSSRTPELYSFNYGDRSSTPILNHESQLKLKELNNERTELKESLEFLECERQALMDASKELNDTLQVERSHWKKEIEDLKNQVTDQIRIRIKAESELIKNEMETNNLRLQLEKATEELITRTKQLNDLEKRDASLESENKQLSLIKHELEIMLSEKLKFNGLPISQSDSVQSQELSNCTSIVTEMAKLRLELNEKDKIIDNFRRGDPTHNSNTSNHINNCSDIDNLNSFLDQTVECIKSWPQELADSCHVQNLMKTLLSAYKKSPDEMILKLENLKFE